MQREFQHWDYEMLARLAQQHGDSFYLFSPAVLKSNLESFTRAFAAHWPQTRLAYSYKTNYMPYLCRLLHQWGCYAEVVSGLEYQLARAIGVPGDEIIFNGPYKQRGEIERALVEGSVVNVDSPYEVELIRNVAANNSGRDLRVGLRAAFVVDDQSTRFGLDVDNGDLERAIDQFLDIPNVNVVGFHTHMMPPGRSPQGYRSMSETMIALYDTYHDRLPLEFLDMGGGFFSKMPQEMGRQFAKQIPTFEDYGREIAGVVCQAFGDRKGPELILEPGMALVADAIQFVARVVDIKSACGRRLALLSGSVYNVKPSKSPRNLPIRRVTGDEQAADYGDLDLVGYTCMEDDILHRNYVGQLATGDFIVFQNVGAYTLTLKPPFIQPNVPVLSVDPDGAIAAVKRTETLEDVFRTYMMNW